MNAFHTHTTSINNRSHRINLKAVEALLFDMDGVLVDSMQGHFRSWQAAFAVHGIDIEWEPFALLEGQSFRTIAQQLCRTYGISEDHIPPLADLKNRYYMQNHIPELYEGVTEILSACHENGFRLGMVTGAHRDRIEATIPETLIRSFHTVVTADDVTKTKPNPEPYQKAALNVGTNPEHCLVFENAPLGIQAAKAAGMTCFAVTTTLSAGHLTEADRIFPDIRDAFRFFLSARQ